MAMAMVGMGMKFPTTCTTRGTSLSIGQDSCSFFKGSTLSLPSFPIIKTRKSVAVAMPVVARKMIQGEVVCATNDKTVRVKVFSFRIADLSARPRPFLHSLCLLAITHAPSLKSSPFLFNPNLHTFRNTLHSTRNKWDM
ncbi:hypothetical protein SUGI_0448700 [Cryptomeria japonica]|nr:hypothetical protein SUGI_0448700 [Cryptomeria japonica]